MDTNKDPKVLADAILRRSHCSVQVGCVLVDAYGVHAWGWNSSGRDGFGEHAEAACLRRSNRSRLAGSVIYVAARRQRNGKWVMARPCHACQKLISKVRAVVYRDGSGVWHGVHHLHGGG